MACPIKPKHPPILWTILPIIFILCIIGISFYYFQYVAGGPEPAGRRR
jgi:hypothetical protein